MASLEGVGGVRKWEGGAKGGRGEGGGGGRGGGQAVHSTLGSRVNTGHKAEYSSFVDGGEARRGDAGRAESSRHCRPSQACQTSPPARRLPLLHNRHLA